MLYPYFSIGGKEIRRVSQPHDQVSIRSVIILYCSYSKNDIRMDDALLVFHWGIKNPPVRDLDLSGHAMDYHQHLPISDVLWTIKIDIAMDTPGWWFGTVLHDCHIVITTC